MSETVTVRGYIRTDNVGSQVDVEEVFDRAEWEAATDETRDAWMRDSLFNFAEWGYHVVDE